MKKTITAIALSSAGPSPADKLRDDILRAARAADKTTSTLTVTIDPSTWINVRSGLSKSSPITYSMDGQEPRLYGARVVVSSSVDGWEISHDTQ